MKVTIPGDTPMERLTNFITRVIAVPKANIDKRAKQGATVKRRRRKRLT